MKIEIPTNCPSCNSELVDRNDILYCLNNSCEAKSSKRIEHFAKTMKIKGLGPSTIDKLQLETINDIYEIDIAYITVCLGSAKLAIKLFDEIEKSKHTQLNTLLPAFGIPLIGKTATEKLSKITTSIYHIDAEICKMAGLGPKATENLLNWLDENAAIVDELPFSFKFEDEPVVATTKGVICISGKLKSFKTKAEASSVLQSLGYRVKDSITKDVTILVNESGRETDKTKKARLSGIEVVENLQTFIEKENNNGTT